MERRFLPFLLFFLLAHAAAQPPAYAPRGTRSYLVNYGAIGGDRFLATFATKRFVLIDEGSKTDISIIRRYSPDMLVLHYKDMVALHATFPEYQRVSLDEYAFLHCGDPASLGLFLRGDTASLLWVPDRRSVDVRYYRIETSVDSTGGFHTLVDSAEAGKELRVRLPKSAAWIRVVSILEDGTALHYGTPVPVVSPKREQPALAVRTISITRNPGRAAILVEAVPLGDVRPDSVAFFCDTNRDNTIDAVRERIPATFDSGRWKVEFTVSEGDRNYGGYEFFITAFAGAETVRTPSSGLYSTNINNRLMNDYYGFFVMDVGSSTWRQAMFAEVLQAFATAGYNGLFEDDTWYRVERWGCDAYPPIAYSDAEWNANMRAALDSMRLVIAPRPAFFNGLYAAKSDSLLLHADGGMTEGFAYTHWSGALSGGSWKSLADIGLRCSRVFRKTWLALGGAPFDDPEGRMYVLGSYFLVCDSLTMYANATNYQEFSHFPEFDIPLGKALTPVYDRIDTLLRPAMPGMAPCYVREFENGTVVVNPHATLPARFDPGERRGRLLPTPGTTIEGSKVGTVPADDSIPPKSARIYIDGILCSPSIDSVIVTPQPAPSDDSTPVLIRALVRDDSHKRLWADSTVPLSVTADAGKLGGPKEIHLNGVGASPPGAPTWFEGTFTVPTGAPTQGADIPITAYSPTGLVTIRFVRVDVASRDSTNLVLNFSYEYDDNEDGIPDLWRPYMKGFDYDTTGVNAISGRRSIHVRNDSLEDFRGAYCSIVLNQPEPLDLELSGWSKAAAVSGAQNNDYALYVDAWYEDGTPLYGQCARFMPGTHDWEYSSKIIHPEKPIRNVTLYALFRRHTGEAWFDHIALRPSSPPAGVPPLPETQTFLSVQPPVPNPTRTAFTLRFSLRKPALVSIRVYDALGRSVFGTAPVACASTPQSVRVDLSGLPPGTYHCMVCAGNETRHIKVFKQ
ncbi:MAG: putative glycoside hydrolase [Bacteroidota bacterium]|nr:putative glycoside hydrolase [Bacteroidota bacterium]